MQIVLNTEYEYLWFSGSEICCSEYMNKHDGKYLVKTFNNLEELELFKQTFINNFGFHCLCDNIDETLKYVDYEFFNILEPINN